MVDGFDEDGNDDLVPSCSLIQTGCDVDRCYR